MRTQFRGSWTVGSRSSVPSQFDAPRPTKDAPWSAMSVFQPAKARTYASQGQGRRRERACMQGERHGRSCHTCRLCSTSLHTGGFLLLHRSTAGMRALMCEGCNVPAGHGARQAQGGVRPSIIITPAVPGSVRRGKAVSERGRERHTVA